MPVMERYETGMFSWADLATTDVAGAKRFPRRAVRMEVRGPPRWRRLDGADDPGHRQGHGLLRAVAGLDSGHSADGPHPVHQLPRPSSWLVYFAVENCDKAVEQASRLGAKVQMPTEDIPDVGRFSVLQDPQGAFFALIQFMA